MVPDSLKIALDYDETYSADPTLWDQFIYLAHQRGHEVHCVTCRRDTEENRQEVGILPGLLWNQHHFTNLSPKKWFMDKKGIAIDIWIDDSPETVQEGR